MITKAREYAEIVNKSFAISKDLLLENSFKQISEEKDNLLKLLSDESIIKVKKKRRREDFITIHRNKGIA